MQTQVTRLSRQRTPEQDTLNLHDWIKHRLDETETDLINLLRWEDDGGVIIHTVIKSSSKPESQDVSRGNPLEGFFTG
ncbi:MAG TPA: hypothetical protein VGK00_08780 [Anaerolineales bacterium]|jgi:hypothetical protein